MRSEAPSTSRKISRPKRRSSPSGLAGARPAAPNSLTSTEKLYRRFQGRDDIVLLAFNVDDDIADMNKALVELKLSIPAVYATPFVYSMLPPMAIPANWLLSHRARRSSCTSTRTRFPSGRRRWPRH